MILRHVKTHQFYQTSSHPHGCWSVMLTLECGHIQRRKSSAWGAGRVRCWECEALEPIQRTIRMSDRA